MANTSLSVNQALHYANQLKSKGKHNEAASIYQQIIQASPQNTVAALELARLLSSVGELVQARNVLASRSNYAQEHFEYLYMLGALSLKTQKLESALLHAENARALNPGSPHACNLLGSIHLEAGHYHEAIQAFLSAIQIDDQFADAYNNIAWCYRALGDKDLALQYFRDAYAIEPSATEALSGQLMLKTFDEVSPEMQEAKRKLDEGKLDADAAAELAFALGKAYEDLKDYDTAGDYFSLGNQTWRSRLDYSIEQDEALFTSITAAPVRLGRSAQPSATPSPIFVVGMPRSGTSLVEQILASHSAVHGAGELTFMAEHCLSNGQFNVSPNLATKYRQKLASLSDNASFVVDKMPQNFRFVGVILEQFPDAKIIHCHRSPKDNWLSLFKHHFPMAQHHYAYKADEIKHYYRLYQEMMAHWNALAPGRIYDLDYEHLIHYFEEDVRALLDHCGLAFEEGCLEFQNTQRAIRTASSDQVRRGLYQSGSGQWQHYEKSLPELFSTSSEQHS